MIESNKVLSALPPSLRNSLIACYERIARNFGQYRWEPAELNGGKFSEVVYTILDGSLKGAYAPGPRKPRDMVAACRALEAIQENPSRVGDRSLRILIPRMLPTLYEIRNNRGVGHVGGDVDPNCMDAAAVFAMASWVMAELVRIFHGVTTEEAQSTVDTIVTRKHPIIWEIDGIKRVLDHKLSKSDQVLLLLYSENGWVSDVNLRKWTEYANATHFKDKVLCPLHRQRLIEFDDSAGRVRLSPSGVDCVEKNLLEKYR